MEPLSSHGCISQLAKTFKICHFVGVLSRFKIQGFDICTVHNDDNGEIEVILTTMVLFFLVSFVIDNSYDPLHMRLVQYYCISCQTSYNVSPTIGTGRGE